MSYELTAYLSYFNLFLTQSLKLSFRNIRGLRSNFVKSESFSSNLDDSIDSGNFSVTSYLPLTQKDSITHMYGLAVYVKEGLPFARDVSLEHSTDSYLCFTTFSVFLFFPLSITVNFINFFFDSTSSSIDEVLSINPSANMFVFGDLTSIIRIGLPILVEPIDLVNFVIIFLSRMTLDS